MENYNGDMELNVAILSILNHQKYRLDGRSFNITNFMRTETDRYTVTLNNKK